ncbi:GPW/gp25 family protein [Amycolatopsis sp. H20-H5]|uniref:GPW/gp25 family protein n=1 Tax=Amycolatopsis sp. H20-H5 TaxID=3046309 RepID=UPI002DBC4610|nr:GPW/gp25 family protein [Amycolatopsis sp. H20-H5]MEC3981861.1 GPW/gp25 family protein [Amycolatopsis sp. H20-H5]
MTTDFTGAGWTYPLDFTASREVALAKGTRKLEQAMRLILATYPGERPMRPNFGARLRDFVFRGATLDNAAALSEEVRRALDFWEPRVEIDGVEVYPDEDSANLLYIDVRYVVKATNDHRNLVFPFYTIPEHGEED